MCVCVRKREREREEGETEEGTELLEAGVTDYHEFLDVGVRGPNFGSLKCRKELNHITILQSH